MPATAAGRPIGIGAQIARGGEGAVHEVMGRQDLAAKIYLTPPGPERVRKLQVMAALPTGRRPRPAAWPTDLVVDGGRVVGFLMPRIHDGREIQELLPPAVRRHRFPAADYKFLAVAAANLARAVAAVQHAGAIIGDINERVALVGADATVVLIDCDSMQIEDDDGTLLRCDVGTPHYQPPENQGRAMVGLRRLRNHDSFGLGVLAFQLLFFGRHPFSGRPLAGDTPDPVAAIRGHQFAWGADAARRGLVAPPNTLPLAAVGPGLAQLFEQAFGADGPRLGRPAATTWAKVLDEFAASLARCGANRMHWSRGPDCPLCGLEAGLGTPLFLAPLAPVSLPDPRRVADQLRLALAAVPEPQVPASPPAPGDWLGQVSPSPPPAGMRPPSALSRVAAVLGVGAAVAWNGERRRREEALERSRDALARGLRAWDFEADRRAIREGRRGLGLLIDRLDGLAVTLDARLDALRDGGREQQLRTHLEGFHLRGTPIEGIGEGRLRTLEGAGIWTAADVTRAALLRAPGIGPVSAERLTEWRARCEQSFRFDARRPVDRRALAQVAADVSSRAAAYEAAARAGIAGLAARSAAVGGRASTLCAALAGLAREVAQAEADLRAMR